MGRDSREDAVKTMLLSGVLLVAGLGTVRAQPATLTQWDGVFTPEQAKRGEAFFANACAACHHLPPRRTDPAPELVGGPFNANWNNAALSELFDFLKESMPQDAPGSLQPQVVADILAFILQSGEFPAGQTELPTQPEVLNTIKFLANKPAP
jgi:cytochrome c